MKKIFTHWTFAFVTLFILTYIGLQDPTIKETLRLKSFDFLIQSQDKSLSDDIIIVSKPFNLNTSFKYGSCQP